MEKKLKCPKCGKTQTANVFMKKKRYIVEAIVFFIILLLCMVDWDSVLNRLL